MLNRLYVLEKNSNIVNIITIEITVFYFDFF